MFSGINININKLHAPIFYLPAKNTLTVLTDCMMSGTDTNTNTEELSSLCCIGHKQQCVSLAYERSRNIFLLKCSIQQQKVHHLLCAVCERKCSYLAAFFVSGLSHGSFFKTKIVTVYTQAQKISNVYTLKPESLATVRDKECKMFDLIK